MNTSEKIEELKAYLKKSGLEQKELADMFKTPQPNISLMINGKKPFGKKNALLWEKKLGIRSAWLLTGDGEMLKTDVKEPPDFLNANGSLYNIVPLWNFDAVGSMGKSNDVTDSPAYIEKYVAFPSARKDDFCVHVTGNSMIPTYCPGSLVLLREVQNWREYFGYGHCFMLFLNDGRRILKEVQKYVENSKEYVTCVSHNREFPSEELPKSMIMSVYKVIATLNNEGF